MKSLFVIASFTIAASVLQAKETKTITEAFASSKINQLLEPYELNINEKIVFAGKTSTGQQCSIEFSKLELSAETGRLNNNSKSVNVTYNTAEPRASESALVKLKLFYEGTTEEYWKNSEDPPTQRIYLKENHSELLLHVQHKMKKSSLQQSIRLSGLQNGKIGSVSAAMDYKFFSFNPDQIFFPENIFESEKESKSETCYNLTPLGKRKYDFNFSGNVDKETDLLTYCHYMYSPLCPNDVSYLDLPSSLGNKRMCDEYKKQSGSYTDMVFCERGGKFEREY